MAHIRRLRYGSPRRIRPPQDNEIEYRIDRGYDGGRPDYRLSNGFSGDVLNMVPSDYGYGLTPRSGLSLQALYFALDEANVVKEVRRTDLNPMWLAVSGDDNSIHKFEFEDNAWSELSRLGAPLSHNSQAYVDLVQTTAASGNRALVLNGTNTPKYVDIVRNVTTWSDFTFHYSITSVAQTGVMSDERFVMANVREGSTSRPTRLVWSVRGTPSNFQVASGAGFADLLEMNSSIMRLIQDTQGFVILADREIWRARPRRDIYAFDFIPITRDVGCPFPKTATQSPFGTIFLGQDYDVYTLSGSTLRSLGISEETQGVSRVQRQIREALDDDPTFAWGVYDYVKQQYHLQVSQTKAFKYDFQTDSWWPIEYAFTAGWAGTMVINPPALDDTTRTWDTTTVTWDELTIPWDDAGVVRPPVEESRLLLTSRVGTPYIEEEGDRQDYIYDYDAYWSTPRMNLGGRRHNYSGTWVEFSTKTASSITVTTQLDHVATSQVRSLQSSNLSVAWAPAHGVSRGVRVKVNFDPPDRVNFTGITGLTRIHSGIGGGR